MSVPRVATWAALLALPVACMARDLSAIDPIYPRIANCYGSALGWRPWEQGADYWSKLDLFIGGCYDLHYDWDNERWPQVLARIEENAAHLHDTNPRSRQASA